MVWVGGLGFYGYPPFHFRGSKHIQTTGPQTTKLDVSGGQEEVHERKRRWEPWQKTKNTTKNKHVSRKKLVSFLFIFTPTWGNDPIWRAYFSNGLKPPLTVDPLRTNGSFWCQMLSCFAFSLKSWGFLQVQNRYFFFWGGTNWRRLQEKMQRCSGFWLLFFFDLYLDVGRSRGVRFALKEKSLNKNNGEVSLEHYSLM